MVEQETKPPVLMRRNFFPEEHDRLQYNYDVKIPFSLGQYYPPRLSIRGMPMKAYGGIGTEPGAAPQEMHYSDPRYMPQDMTYDDKRLKNFYGYPILSLTPAHGGMMGILNPNQPGMMNNGMPGSVPSSMATGIGAMGMAGATMTANMGMGGSNMNSSMGSNIGHGMVHGGMGPNVGAGLGHGIGPGIGSDANHNNLSNQAMGTGMSLGSGIGPVPMLMTSGAHSQSLPNVQNGVMSSSVPASISSSIVPNSHEADHSMNTANTSINGSNALPNVNQQTGTFPGKLEEGGGLVSPIPPLHIQQQLVHKEDEHKIDAGNQVHSKCSRCKKEFTQSLIVAKDSFLGKFGTEPKIFKLCDHCRDLQRERLRRWQKKTKDKQGACRRCGNDIPADQQKYVLCPLCRQNLRIRKANRAAQGKCVHCSGPINLLIINEEHTDENGRRSSVAGNSYKVCQRCRENDKIRRTNLERMGNCNRCAKALSSEEQGRHKVCLNCRQKKKKIGSVSLYSGFPGVPSMVTMENSQQGVSIPPPPQKVAHMNYVPVEQSSMIGPGPVNQMINVGNHMSQQDYAPSYPQVIQLPDMYKAPMAQYSMQQQQQPDQNQQGQYLLQRPQFNR